MDILGQGLTGSFHSNKINSDNTAFQEIKNSAANIQDVKNLLLDSLEPGSFLFGQVQSANENSALLLLENGQKLLAQLAEGVALSPGENVALQVEEKKDKTIVLKPMFADAQLEATAEKALKEAGFMKTSKNLEIVRELLELKMPVDKNSIRSLLQKSLANPDVSVKHLAIMEKLEIPITKENIDQISDYQAKEHKIEKQMFDMLNEINDALKDLVSDGKMSEAAAFQKNILDLIMKQLNEKMDADSGEQSGTLKNTNDLEQANLSEQINDSGQAKSFEHTNPSAQRSVLQHENGGMNSNISDSADDTIQMKESKKGELSDDKALSLKEETVKGEEAKTLKSLMELRDKVLQAKEPEELKNILLDKKTSMLLEKGMRTVWQIKPEQFKGKETINRTYERMEEQVREIEKLIQKETDVPVSLKSVGKVQQNLSFMQDFNQILGYVQLPLQMAGENAHGDLYVFKDKHKRHEEGEPLTAFLHLNMEHLGDVDVYLKMHGKNVSTDITLEKEEVLDLFEKHIDELASRLEDKGYSVNMSVKKKEKTFDFTEDILQKQAGEKNVGRFSFDVKA